MDIFFLQLIIIFIPGLIWKRIDNRFGVNRPSSQFDIARRSFGFGIAAYLAMVVIYVALGQLHPAWTPYLQFKMATFKKDTYSLDSGIVSEIFVASGIALLLSIIWLYVTNNKFPTRFMQLIRATKRFGDEDVWDFTFNSREATVEYGHVRDLENELNWSGWVELFSETGKIRELVLRDVEVTNLAGEKQYDIPRVYLSRPADAITIEFPYVSMKGGQADD